MDAKPAVTVVRSGSTGQGAVAPLAFEVIVAGAAPESASGSAAGESVRVAGEFAAGCTCIAEALLVPLFATVRLWNGSRRRR